MNLYDGNGVMIPIGEDSVVKSPWLNLSHKGQAPDMYGNSIYAFNRSHEYGADGTELDLRMTSDNIVVCSHDSDITGNDSQGVSHTLSISSNTYADLSALTLFTIDNVDYHLLKFEDVARMAFYWGWTLQLDFKPASNTTECRLKGAEIIRDNGLCGKAMYITGSSGQATDILAIDPLAMFDIGATADISGTVLASLPVNRVWRAVDRTSLSTYVRDEHPFYVYDAGASQANDIMSYQPNAIQWQADTDGVSLSETYLANVDWE